MLPNSPDLIGSLPIQDRKLHHPDRHFKNPDLTKIGRYGQNDEDWLLCIVKIYKSYGIKLMQRKQGKRERGTKTVFMML